MSMQELRTLGHAIALRLGICGLAMLGRELREIPKELLLLGIYLNLIFPT